MTKEKSDKLKNGGLGIIIGMVISMTLGFTWGGWVTASTAKEMNEEAVLASHAAICVAQFMKAPEYDAQLKAFQKVEVYEQSGFIEKGGWDRMPGDETARIYVSDGCAAGIVALLEK